MDNDNKKTIEDMVSEIRSLREGLEAEKRAIEQERAAHDKDNPTNRSFETASSWRDVASAMKEKRAVTLSGTGNIAVIHDLIKEAQKKTPLLGMARTFTGPNASTNIPVWSPTIATPSNYAEGATTVASDTQGKLGATTITPYAYISVLPVSNETLLMTGSTLEAELPTIFGEAFASAMHAGIVSGDGTSRNMKGIFNGIAADNQIECAAAGMPTMADVVGLALKLQDYYDDGVIVMNPAVYSALTSTTVSGYDFYKEELIRNKRVEGVQVILTSYAPTDTAAGKIIVAGGRMSDYAIGIAAELTIEPLKKVGDNNTYFQAVAYFNGTPILDKNFWGLKAKAGA